MWKLRRVTVAHRGLGIALALLLLLLTIPVAGCGEGDDDAGGATTADATPPMITLEPLNPYNIWQYQGTHWTTTDSTPRFTGRALANTVVDNWIALVQCRVDGGDWIPAEPVDRTDFAQETLRYTFEVNQPLALGYHTVTARASDSLGLTTEPEDYALVEFFVEPV